MISRDWLISHDKIDFLVSWELFDRSMVNRSYWMVKIRGALCGLGSIRPEDRAEITGLSAADKWVVLEKILVNLRTQRVVRENLGVLDLITVGLNPADCVKKYTVLTFMAKYVACEHNLSLLVDYAIAAGADINEPNARGRRPLSYALRQCGIAKKVVDVLLRRGALPQADPEATMYDIGELFSQEERSRKGIIILLEKYGFAPRPDCVRASVVAELCNFIIYDHRWWFLEKIIAWGYAPRDVRSLVRISYHDGKFDMELLRHLLDIGASVYNNNGGIDLADVIAHSVTASDIIGMQLILDAAARSLPA